MNALEVTQAKKRYGTREALAGASLELQPGELLALLGPNGAGKTTLVRAVAGRVRLDSGTIAIFGRAVPGVPDDAQRARIGYVPQEIALYPLLTARENLEAFGAFHGVTGDRLREKVDWALEWTGLADRRKEPVKTFSGGMKRRLNIACGVLHDPGAILLDEPTVGVDPQSRLRIDEMLDRLRADGTALLLTTHQLDEAERRADRIAILDQGRVVAQGTFDELVRSTAGPKKEVVLRLDRVPAIAPAGLEPPNGDGTWSAAIDDVGRELAPLLARVAAAGCAVEHLEVRRPTLQSVFLHLTGRELRE
jgi:ABC-2 type transport system ATP-binding protein